MSRRILLLITDLEIGGTPTVVRELATRLNDPPNVVVEVACLKGWGPVADQLRDAGIRVTTFDAAGIHHLPRTLVRLIRLIQSGRFDTVFSFLLHSNALSAMASLFCRGARFIQSVQTTQRNPKWHWIVQGLVQSPADAFVVPSPSVADAVVERSHVPAARITVIPNAIDPSTFPRSPIPVADPRPYPIGFIGRLDPVKHVDYIVGGLAMRHAGSHDIEFHIFGEGPERQRIQQAIDRADANSWVTLHGAVGSPREALARLGALILYSEAEGFGLVLIEAMAAGVPVIGTRVPGIRDVIRDRQNGLLVTFPSPAELHFAVSAIIEDLPLRATLIEAGLQEVRDRYTWDVILPPYRRLLGL